MTTEQIRARTKTVTRRLGWAALKPGDRFRAVVKAQGLKRGERMEVLAELECVSNTQVQLSSITLEDCAKEGFPRKTPPTFTSMFCKHMGCEAWAHVNRIEFKYV